MALIRCGGGGSEGNAITADVLSGKTFSNDDDVGLTGEMTNNGAVNVTLDTTTTSYTVPEGYHNGSGTVGILTQSKNTTPSTRSATAATVTPDSGKVLSKVTVDTTSVPNSNSGTYTFPSNDTGGTKDLGVTNTYRYVNASNVYNKGKADGSSLNLKYISNSGNSWTSDKDYKEIYAIGVRGSVPALTYTGNGTVTELGRVYTNQYFVVYKISPCNKNDKITNNYISAVLAIP